ncbi:MAG: glutamine amidotransferase [Chloroflexota bacterium]
MAARSPVSVLYVGDSETVINRYAVGADVFEQAWFNDNGKYLREALAGRDDVVVRHIIPANVPAEFPASSEELARYDVVIFSDVGSNTMLFYPGLTPPYAYPLGRDRLRMTAEFARNGGGFLMVGGYLSFAGINGIARYHGTVIEDILPVSIQPYDDRVEMVEGFRFAIDDPGHPIVRGFDWDRADFTMCGYNRVTLKPGASLIASWEGDPIIAAGRHGAGRTAVFATDFGPHWGGDFLRWEGYADFWAGFLRWLAGEDQA